MYNPLYFLSCLQFREFEFQKYFSMYVSAINGQLGMEWNLIENLQVRPIR